MDQPSNIGPYEVTDELGRGGMGRVYRAVAPDGSVVAVKTVQAVHRAALASIRREIAALARARVPGVVRIRDHGVHEGLPWYAMDHVEGQALLEWGSGQPLAEKLRVVGELLATLGLVHALGIVHRDLKSENVLVGADGRPILVDFGISTRGHSDRGPGSVVHSGEGTVGYMAPEQLLGEDVDARTDLYAVGVLLHELVGGTHPFGGRPGSLAVAALRWQPTPLREHAPTVPEALERLVADLLATRSQDRPAYAADALERLDRIRRVRTQRPPLPTYLYPASFVGREAELAVLGQALRGLPELKGGLALVGGASGSGKSRLASELAKKARERGYEVLLGSCRRDGGGLHPWRPVLRRLADLAREGGPVAEARLLEEHGPVLATFEPLLAELPGVQAQGPPPTLREDHARLRLTDALTTTLGNLAGCWPGLVVVVDDLQWADDATLALITELCRGVVEPALVVGLYRSEEAKAVEAAVSEAPLASVQLAPLDSRSVEQMVRQVLALPHGGDLLVERLVERCGGSPFFVAELLRAGVEQGTLARENGQWVLAADAAERLPVSAADAILGRLARCGPEARAVVQAASVLHKGPDESLLRELCQLSDRAWESALGELSIRHLLTDERGAPRFVHDQQHEVAYAELDPQTRVALHERAADLMAARGSDPVTLGEVARHALASGQRARARDALVEATRKARVLFMGIDAVALAERAIGLEQGPDAIGREMRSELANLHARQGNYRVSLDLYREGLALNRALDDDPSWEAALSSGLALMATRCGEAETVVDARARAVALLPQTGGAQRMDALRHLGVLARETGDYGQALELLTEALQNPDLTSGGRASLLGNLALAMRSLGRLEESATLHREALRVGQENDDPVVMGAACGALAVDAYMRGDPDLARDLFRKAAAHHRRAYYRVVEVAWLSNLADLERERGALDIARGLLLEVLEWHKTANNEAGHAIARANLGVVELEAGDPELALVHLDEAVERARKAGRPVVACQVLEERARAALFAGELDLALESALEALGMVEPLDALTHVATCHEMLGHVRLAQGADPEPHLEALAEAVAVMKAGPLTVVGRALARLQRAVDATDRVAGYAVEDVPDAYQETLDE